MRAKAKEMVIVEIFKNITDIKPVRALCNWYESWDNLIDNAPGVFYFLSK